MSNLPETQNLFLAQTGGWLTIWFNRPEARNALSKDLMDELRAVLHAVRDDRAIRGITLRGKGGVFSAGGDLKGFKSNYQAGAQSVEDVARSSRAGGEMFDLLNEMPQVVVMLVEGAAIAGGLGMVCTGDVVAVTKDAKFAMTETTLGIPPAQIAPFVVQRLGLRVARRLMVTAARFDGAEAGRLGLADHVVDDAAGLERIEAESCHRLRVWFSMSSTVIGGIVARSENRSWPRSSPTSTLQSSPLSVVPSASKCLRRTVWSRRFWIPSNGVQTSTLTTTLSSRGAVKT